MENPTSDERPVFDQFNLVVNDMSASVAFYRRLGLEISDPGPDWEAYHQTATTQDGVDLDFDSPPFARHWDQGWRGGMGVLGFRVPSREAVDRIYADLTGAGYTGQQPPYDAFWGSRYAVVEDPDGNPVGLMSPSDDAHRQAPPDPTAFS